MNHDEAIRLNAAEKYLLGELSAELRDEFEDHYFGCAECALDVQTGAVFIDNARDVLSSSSVAEIGAKHRPVRSGGWWTALLWLRPAFAIPIFALLVLTVGFQNVVTIPRLKSATSSAMKMQDGDFVSLVGADTREEGGRLFRIRRDRPAILEVDIPRVSEFANYVCELQDESGRSLYQERVSANDAKTSVHFIVPRGELQAGKYAVIILSETPANSGAVSQTEIGRLPFTIELVP